MSRFKRPETGKGPTKAEIDRVIAGAEARDGVGADEAKEKRFTMTLPEQLADDVDRARERSGLTRLAWIRLAITEKLEREGR